MKEKTFTSVELKKALEKGYKIDGIHSALKLKRYTGLMKDYVALFLRMKVENTQEFSAEERRAINQQHKDLGFDFVIEPKDTRKNKGLRAIAKLCLNSSGGNLDRSGRLTNILRE